METRIRWYSDMDGVAAFLKTFSRRTSIPYFTRNRPFPFYAYFDNTDVVLAAAMEEGIDETCLQL